jgi:flagellar assembly protein FliH
VVEAGALSPFAAFVRPIPPPRVAAPASRPVQFPDIEVVQKEQVVRKRQEYDPQAFERERAENARRGYEEGYAEGRARGLDDGREEGVREGHAEGYREGLAAGVAEGLQRDEAQREQALAEFAAALQGQIDTVNARIAAWFSEREEAMAGLAMAAVRRLLSHELQTTRQSAVAIVQDALGELTHATHARIRVSPLDIPILDAHRGALIATAATLRDIDLVPDESIEGGCIVETEGGVVDTRLAVRLEELEDAWRPAA